MKVRFWGTRGSIATPGPSTVRYGGNTSCVEVRSDSGALVVLDCGTGARLLGQSLVAECARDGRPASGCMFIGHTHWDHIQGLPFFAPLFDPTNDWDVYGPRGLGQSLATTLSGQMQYQYFPVTVDQLGATVRFHDLVEGRFEIGDLTVTTQYLNHPALTLGYRIEGDGVSVVYACDHEPFDPELAAGGDLLASAQDARHVEFLAGADLVVHDAQYDVQEYAQKRGWGHSTSRYAVDAARLGGVGRLALFHHDPARDDAALDVALQVARDYAVEVGYAGEVVAAAEGATLEVRPHSHPAVTAARLPAPRATYEPALDDLTASVVLTAQDEELCAAIRAAADAEQMPVVEAAELPAAGRSVVVLDHDHDQDSGLLRRLRQALGETELVVLALTRGRPAAGGDGLIGDWLVWPASIGHIRTKLRAAVLRRACRWQSAPLPPDEADRLAALHALGVLDTAPEDRFDRYTRDACDRLDVPMAFLSLVDADRQWFKSRQGSDLQETPRDESLCAHAILGTDVLQVPDLLEDDRFADNPVTRGPDGMRFYAGVPLILGDGSRVGTLCVADQRPRVLDDTQLDELRRLAEQVRDELDRAPA